MSEQKTPNRNAKSMIMPEPSTIDEPTPQPNIRKFLLQLLIDLLLFPPTFIVALVLPWIVAVYAAQYIETPNILWQVVIFLIIPIGFFGVLFIGVRIASLIKSRLGVQYFWEPPVFAESKPPRPSHQSPNQQENNDGQKSR